MMTFLKWPPRIGLSTHLLDVFLFLFSERSVFPPTVFILAHVESDSVPSKQLNILMPF